MSKYYYVRGKRRNKKLILRLVGICSILFGIILTTYFLFPLISYQIFLLPVFAQNNIEVPVPKYLVKDSGIGSLLTQGFKSFGSDYTDARKWYPNLNNNLSSPKVESYLISIPKLKIENAKVSTTDYDLSQHLVQFLGTSTPPDNGNAVIFGHSTLPQLFDPKNYKAIFATLHTIKTGDEIFIDVNGVKFKYKVFSISITDPDDTNILSQSYDNSYLTIVTCTPPGTIWKRLIVKAKLEPVNGS